MAPTIVWSLICLIFCKVFFSLLIFEHHFVLFCTFIFILFFSFVKSVSNAICYGRIRCIRFVSPNNDRFSFLVQALKRTISGKSRLHLNHRFSLSQYSHNLQFNFEKHKCTFIIIILFISFFLLFRFLILANFQCVCVSFDNNKKKKPIHFSYSHSIIIIDLFATRRHVLIQIWGRFIDVPDVCQFSKSKKTRIHDVDNI